MKLTELDPHWVGLGEPSCEIKIGLTFRCPHCPESGQRLGVLFDNPIDPQGWTGRITWPQGTKWKRSGETFETLTLDPSVNCEIAIPPHWHGFIINGEIR